MVCSFGTQTRRQGTVGRNLRADIFGHVVLLVQMLRKPHHAVRPFSRPYTFLHSRQPINH